MRRRLKVSLLVVALGVSILPLTVSAEMGPDGIYPMVFPIQGGAYRLTDSFGDPRAGHLHEGEDIMTDGVKGLLVVAAAGGTVGWMANQQGGNCCAMQIEHDDGWATRYIHLNNDTQNPDGSYSDDGQGWGFAPGIGPGVRVEAGQVIGYVGDSGNAENVGPHLHFELRNPDGVAVDPYASLLAAELNPLVAPPCPEGESCDTVAFQEQGGRFDLWEELVFNAALTSFFYGNPGDVPFSGDWDCDGVETPGLYRRSDGYVYLRNSNSEGVADVAFFFGNPGDYPMAGDFDDNGCDSVSIYRPAEQRFYVINELGSNDGGLGAADFSFLFGNAGDKPFVGDFNGDGVDTVGLHRESTGLVYFRNLNTTGVADSQFIYGDPGDMLVAGDWDGNGSDTIGVYRPSDGVFYLKNSNVQGVADASFHAGEYAGVIALLP
ncbi:MAG: M23 family metallopeptidase [Acidimicrobiia bacterium]